ncbi:MAG: GNAT family N-acetyltransferase [Promethearchaeota archaeon]
MHNYNFIELKEEDLPYVLKIYNHYVLNTTATFQIEPLKINEMKESFLFKKPCYKSFIIQDNDNICGYVSIGQYKNRGAYDGTAEISIYLDKNYIGRGIGTLSLKYAEEFAKKQNFHVLIAVISEENKGSIKFFEKNNFEKCAHLKEIGMKFGRLIDVVFYQKIL